MRLDALNRKATFDDWIEIQWRADEIYVRKFCAAVVDSLINLDNFFCSLDMSENQIVNYLRAIESQPWL